MMSFPTDNKRAFLFDNSLCAWVGVNESGMRNIKMKSFNWNFDCMEEQFERKLNWKRAQTELQETSYWINSDRIKRRCLQEWKSRNALGSFAFLLRVVGCRNWHGNRDERKWTHWDAPTSLMNVDKQCGERSANRNDWENWMNISLEKQVRARSKAVEYVCSNYDAKKCLSLFSTHLKSLRRMKSNLKPLCISITIGFALKRSQHKEILYSLVECFELNWKLNPRLCTSLHCLSKWKGLNPRLQALTYNRHFEVARK